MKNWVVNVKNISKRYKLYAHPGHRALEWISLGHTMWHSDFWALKNVSFHVRSGECLGIIGPNGAGKSTLLKIISRSLYPTEGTFEVKGRMVSLLELGTGFNPELTGIQNIFSSARLLGFSEEYVNDRLEGILDFADLGEFIHRPIMTYSSGMYVRLAFSLFACLDPDVYVIDEALSVGDASFQKKCIDRIYEMRKNGVTFLYVSHDLWRVEALCDKVIYLDGGSIKTWDAPSVAIQSYLDDIEKKLDRTKALTSGAMASGTPSQGTADEPKPLTPQFEMYQDSPLRIHRVWVEGAQQTVRTEFYVEEDFFVALEYHCSLRIKEPVFRVVFALPDERRVSVVGWHPGANQYLEPGTGILRWHIQGGTLFPRKYVLHVSVAALDGVVYDTHYGVCGLQIQETDRGPVIRLTDDLSAYLDYSVYHQS